MSDQPATNERGGELLSGMTTKERQGQQLLTTCLTMIVLSDLGISLFTVLFGSGGWLSRSIRIGLTILMCTAIYHGSRLAKWFAVVAYSLGAGVAVGLIFVATNRVSTGLLIGLVVVCVSLVAVLVGSRKVHAFLEYQRWKREGRPNSRSARSSVAGVCPMCGGMTTPGAVKCEKCGEGLPQVNAAGKARPMPGSFSPRRGLIIAALVIAAPVALIIYGHIRHQRVFTKITISYQHAPPQLVERRIAIPLEVALAGMPYQREQISFSRQGKMEMYITWDSKDGLPSLQERLPFLSDELPKQAGAPLVETVAEVPAARLETEVALTVSVKPNKVALQSHDLVEDDVWSAVAPIFSESDDAEDQLALLNRVLIKMDSGDVLLTDVADIDLVESPICIIRKFGFRLDKNNFRRLVPEK